MFRNPASRVSLCPRGMGVGLRVKTAPPLRGAVMPGSARAALLSPRKAGLRGPVVGLLPGIASLASRVLPGDVLGAWHGLQPAELPSKVTDPARASRHIPQLSCCPKVTTVGSRGHFPAGWLCRARRGSQGKAGSGGRSCRRGCSLCTPVPTLFSAHTDQIPSQNRENSSKFI